MPNLEQTEMRRKRIDFILMIPSIGLLLVCLTALVMELIKHNH